MQVLTASAQEYDRPTSPEFPLPLAVGTTLASYRIESVLGRGGMGEVYLATHESLGRKVALKLLAPELAADPGFRARFIAESRLAASLDHPHIVPIYEAGETDRHLFIAMRYVEGADLGAILAREAPLQPARALGLLRGVADALDAAHDQGLVHRDVKPANILVARTSRGNEHAYLGDFGLVKRVGSDSGFTRSNQFVGSIDYVAPEQLAGGPIDGRVDVYSLACVLYATLTGRPPYERETEMAVLWAHAQSPPPKLSDVVPGLAVLDPVIERGMAKDPAARYKLAGELLDAAEQVTGLDRARRATEAAADVELPFVGLRPFDEADARFYVGREAEVETLVGRLAIGRFIAIFGPSGSGKSSLVRAGVVPALRRGALPGSETWSIQVLRLGALPIEAIAARLVRLRDDASMGAMVDDLAGDSRALHHATELMLAESAAAARVVWVIDQAEELFTLVTDDEARRAVIANLIYAATVPAGRTVVVLAMRADFYHRCAAYPDLASLVAGWQHLVSPLDPEALRRTIEEPARLVGLDLEPGLVDTILDDVADRPGSLPLLEHALFELWDRRRGRLLTLAGYRESGGIEGAIAVRTEATFAELDPAEQAVARRIFLRLVQPGEGAEDTRRRAALDELGPAREAEATQRVVEALVDARLLSLGTAEESGEPVIDLAHEALLRAWPRLREWIDADREALRIARRVSEAAAEWDRLGKEDEALLRGARLAEAAEFREHHAALLTDREWAFVEASLDDRDRRLQQSRRRQRVALGTAAGLAVFFLALSGLAAVLWRQSEVARTATLGALAEADKQRSAAEEGRVQAESAKEHELVRYLIAQSIVRRDRLDVSTLLALEAVGRSNTTEAWDNLSRAINARPEVRTMLEAPGRVLEMAATRDGRMLAIRSETQPAADFNNFGPSELSIWSVAPWGKIAGPFPMSGDPEVTPNRASHMAFTPDGRALAFASSDNTLTIVELAGGRQSTSSHLLRVSALAWDPEGKVVTWVGPSSEADRPLTIRHWDPATGETSSVVPGPDAQPKTDGPPVVALMTPDARYLTTSDYGTGRSHVFDTARGHLIGSYEGVAEGFSVGGDAVIVSTADGVRVLSLPNLKRVGRAASLAGGVIWAAADLASDRIAVWTGGEATMSIFGLKDGQSVIEAQPGIRNEPSDAIAIGNAGAVFVAHGRTIEVVTLDVRPRLLSAVLPGTDAADGLLAVDLSPDGSLLARYAQEPSKTPYRVIVSETATGNRVAEIRTDITGGEGLLVAFSDQGDAILTLAPDGTLSTWPINDPSSRRTMSTDPLDPNMHGIRLAVGPDGSLALSSLGRTEVRDPPQPVVNLPPGGRGAFRRDSRQLILAAPCPESRVTIFSLADGLASENFDIEGCPAHVATGPNGRFVVATSNPADDSMSLDVYEAGRLGRIGRVDVGGAYLSSIAMVDPGTAAVVLDTGYRGSDGKEYFRFEVRRFDVDPESWRIKACELAGRNLTRAEWTAHLGQTPYQATCPNLPGG